MTNNFILDNKEICIYEHVNSFSGINLIYIPLFKEEIPSFLQLFPEKTSNFNYIIVFITGFNRNDDLTPYEKTIDLHGLNTFKGNGEIFLDFIANQLSKNIENYLKCKFNYPIENKILIGYSLAGLFSIYAGTKTAYFDKLGSVSGSLWYPEFDNYLLTNNLNLRVKTIYFSLGNKENKTNNLLMKTVKEKTLLIKNFCDSKNIKTIYQENEGNHFKDSTLRMIRAINWLLEN